MQTIIDESKLREVFKDVLVEMFEKKKNVFHDIVIEAMEDIALSRAIQGGEGSGTASRQEVFDILENRS
jgi:hypothetical protein